MPEERVRAAMQFLVSTTSEFSVTHRLCSGCGTTTRLVALQQ
jgi:ribosomal protein L32